jgi:hypothetical protein
MTFVTPTQIPWRDVMTHRTLVAASACVFGLLFAGGARANQPSSRVVVRVAQPVGGVDASHMFVSAHVTNGHDRPVHVRFGRVDLNGFTASVTPDEIDLAAGESSDLRLVLAATKPGKQALIVPGEVTTAEGNRLVPTSIQAFFRATLDAAGGLRAEFGEFKPLFVLDGRKTLRGIGPTYETPFGVGPAPRVQENPVPVMGIVRPTERRALANEDTSEIAAISAASERALAESGEATMKLTVKGKWFWIDTANNYRNGWGWRAVLFYWNGSSWVDSGGRGTVGLDSKYSVTATVPLSGYRRIGFYPSNRYFDLVNGNSVKYNWTLPQFNGYDTLYTYPWAAVDLSNNGAAPGLGELHRSAYTLWTQLNDFTTTDPVRSDPIKIVYPGTDDCGACSTDGAIHLPVDSATNNRTIKHELGHELMNEKWGDNPGPGGYHEWDKCASEGLALSEGFAHFLAWWSNVAQDISSGSWSGTDSGESLPSGYCKTPGKNEMRVAAAFWDLHDSKIDGVDDYVGFQGDAIDRIFKYNHTVYSNYITLRYKQLEKYGGLEWWKIEPVSDMNFAE